MSGTEYLKREFSWKIQDAWSPLYIRQNFRILTVAAATPASCCLLSPQRKHVALAWPGGRIRKEWWSFSFYLHLAHPLKGKLATSNNTLVMTNSEVSAGSDSPWNILWLKQRVLAQKGVPQTKWKRSSQMDSKIQRKKEKWRVGDETVYLEFDSSH